MSAAGNVLEWYDFALYGFFSDIIGQEFFPPSNSDHENLIYSYLVFGGAFVARPVGGIVTGHIGDKHGRKVRWCFHYFACLYRLLLWDCSPHMQWSEDGVQLF